MYTLKQTHRTCYSAVCLLALLATTLLPGCGSKAVAKLEDYLEDLEFDRPLDADIEIKVNGDLPYRIPCAARHHDAVGANVPPLWVQMKFDLFVIAADRDEKAVLASIARHRGMLDDTVHSVCRRSSVDQLQESDWKSLKSRLLDAIRPLLGEDKIRRITFGDSPRWEPI